jgi:hypothetical protein
MTNEETEQLAYAIKALESYSEVMSRPGARAPLATMKFTLLSVAPATVVDYFRIWNETGGENDLAGCEYAVALTLSTEFQPTAEKFFRTVTLLHRN